VRGNFENQTTADEQRYRPTYTRQMDATGLSWHSPELETNRLFLQFLGIDAGPGELWPEFWTTHGDASSAGALLGGGEGPLLGIAPGAVSPPGKRLPAGWFIDSVREARLDGTRIVLLGGRNEIAVCGEIEWELVKSGAREVVNAAGQTNVRQLVECIRACDFLLCADSAPLHIATALRKPVAGIMGGGHFGRFYPWGEPALSRVVSKPMECYGCNWTCKFETMRCVQEIHPSDAARELRVLYDHVLNTNRGLQPALQ
jgi:ADP-heptose:LPS heptosyltransferase